MQRRSCPLFPLGMRSEFVRGTLFPLRVRLTLGSPGLPGNTLLKEPRWCTRAALAARSRLSPYGYALGRHSCKMVLEVTMVRFASTSCQGDALPTGFACVRCRDLLMVHSWVLGWALRSCGLFYFPLGERSPFRIRLRLFRSKHSVR